MRVVLLFLICATFSTANLHAQNDGPNKVKASPHPIDYKNPDGTRVVITMKGDQNLHWAETSDGYTVLATPEKYYVYAFRNKKGDLVPSKIKAHSPEERGKKENKFIKKLEKGLTFSETQIQNSRTKE